MYLLYIQSALCTIWKLFYKGSGKSFNYRYKTYKKLTKNSLPTICLMAYTESAIPYNLGSTFEPMHLFVNSTLPTQQTYYKRTVKGSFTLLRFPRASAADGCISAGR